MFKKLIIKGGITTKDGRILYQNNTYDFKDGITAIIGPNGSGKSLLIEFCAFALFGVSALRLSSDNYKGLKVEAEIEIKGKKYLIHRSINSCLVYFIDEKGHTLEAATGVKACNEYIIKVLGYNYQIYEMGNYAAQEEIIKLCQMKPSERKSAVDKVLGLGVIDLLIKSAAETGKTYLDEANGMEKGLGQEPEVPVEPNTGGLSKQQLEEFIKATQSIIDRKNVVEGLIKSLGNIPAPVEPVKPADYIPTEDLKNALSKKLFCEKMLNQINSIKKPEIALEELASIKLDWEAYNAYTNYQEKLLLIPNEKPEIPLEEALTGCTDWYNYNVYTEKKKALEKELITCPQCKHQFTLSGKWEDLKEIPSKPEKDENFYKSQVELNHIWENITEPDPVPEAPMPKVTLPDVDNLQSAWKLYEENQKSLPGILLEYEDCKGVSQEQFLRSQAYEQALSAYAPAKEAFNEYIKKSSAYRSELEQIKLLGNLEESKKIYSDFLLAINIYDNELSNYEKAKKKFDDTSKEIKKLKKHGEQYKKASENLKEMKVKIKRYFIPSLQKASSRLLYEMSDGLYDSVEIDDDFNITVRGMDVAGFSGSEKAMINLAVRLGLGQVLTHKSFNVFIGDEIDASMSPERAQMVTDCLGKLKNHIKQIILVSHRQITADNYIKLN